MQIQSRQETKTLHEALINSRRSWKIGRVFGRDSSTGEPFDIKVEPIIGNVKVISIDHLGEDSTGIFLCANEKRDITHIRDNFTNIGSGFIFNSDECRHFWVKPGTTEAKEQIENLIAKLTRDSQ